MWAASVPPVLALGPLRLVVFDQLPTARTITLSGTKAAILVSADVEKWLWRVKQASLLTRTGSPLCHLCNRCGRLPGLQVAEPGRGPSGCHIQFNFPRRAL